MTNEPMRAVLVRRTSHRMASRLQDAVARPLRWWFYHGPGWFQHSAHYTDLTEAEYASLAPGPDGWPRKIPGLARARVNRAHLGQCISWT